MPRKSVNTAGLLSTRVLPGSYGSAARIPVFTLGLDGRIISCTSAIVSIDETNLQAGTLPVTGLFGDGSDGAAVADGAAGVPGCNLLGTVYTALRDLYLSSLTVETNITLDMDGFRLYCTGTITVEGTGQIICEGKDALNEVGGSSSGSATASTNSGSGGGNGSIAGGGAAGNVGSNATSAVGGNGGAGGDSIAGGGGNAGGAGGALTAPVESYGSFRCVPQASTGKLIGNGGVISFRAGTGGGGGGNEAGGSAGGGGGAGGVLIVCAKEISVAATNSLSVKGGDGFAGFVGSAGGGGGGGGGVLILVYQRLSGAGAVLTAATAAPGGAGGAGIGTGAAGSAGSTGTLVKINV